MEVSDTEICVTGRVSYQQLAKQVGRPTRRPAADTISVTGHLLSGSPNVLWGSEANYLYDFVTKYTVAGVESTNTGDGTMVDDLFAASRGTIDGVCFDKATFAPEEVSYYSFGHDTYLIAAGNVDIDTVAQASSFYASDASIVTESYIPADKPFLGISFGGILNTVITVFANVAPAFLFNILPLISSRGFFRSFVVGTTNTNAFPHPTPAPGQPVEDVQIDVAWDVLMDAMRDGLFTSGDGIVPSFFGVQGKRISKGGFCWEETDGTALDIVAPQGQGAALDAYIEDIVMPKLQEFGGADVSMHMGKRIKSGSALVNSALSYYESQCGVELNVNVAECYHAMCMRTNEVSEFTYPAAYFT